jgi:hypothetical protein
MIHELENGAFFSEREQKELAGLGLPSGDGETETREAFGALMLAPLMELSVADGATTSTEFGVLESYIRSLETEFELGTQEKLESLGTSMGLLPFLRGEWKTEHFATARTLLSGILERISERSAHDVRNAISKGCLEVAEASGGLIHIIHSIPADEQSIVHDIIQSLRLDTCAEGLKLVAKARKN